MQRRLVLMLNHVLQQEPEAQARLKRQTGRVVEAHWRVFSVRLQATMIGESGGEYLTALSSTWPSACSISTEST